MRTDWYGGLARASMAGGAVRRRGLGKGRRRRGCAVSGRASSLHSCEVAAGSSAGP